MVHITACITSGSQYSVSLLGVVMVEPGQNDSLWMTVDITAGPSRAHAHVSHLVSQVDWDLANHSRQHQHLHPCTYIHTCIVHAVGSLDCRVSWVRIPPRAALLFFEKKELSWVYLTCLPCLAFLPHCLVFNACV